jgi:hypothetical protein
MMLSKSGDDRRDSMATTIQQIHPVAHLPLVLGVLRRLEVASVIDRLIPPHPAHGLSCGRGVEALVLAILDGHHALYKVGKRLEERGMVALLQPGLTRAARGHHAQATDHAATAAKYHAESYVNNLHLIDHL